MSRVAVVTGASQGLGSALVDGLCRTLGLEHAVHLTARDDGRGAEAVAPLRARGWCGAAAARTGGPRISSHFCLLQTRHHRPPMTAIGVASNRCLRRHCQRSRTRDLT